MRLLVGMVAVAVVLAGCSSSAGPTGATARQGTDAASAAATAWSPDAVLVGIVTAGPAKDVAQGRASEWTYVFGAEGKNHHHRVTVDADGSVVEEKDRPRHELYHGEGPLSGWTVDSAAAAATLLSEDPTLQAAADGDADLQWLLGTGEDGPSWIAALQQGESWYFAAVHAASGAYLGTTEMPGFGVGNVTPQAGAFSGQVDITAPSDTYTFDITAGHAGLSVTATLAGTSVASKLEVTLTGPEETTGQLTLQGTPSDTRQDEVAVPSPPQGQWTITVELTEGALQDYNISWCAEGNGGGPGDGQMGGGVIGGSDGQGPGGGMGCGMVPGDR